MSHVKITIDGQTYTAEAGQTILDVARENDIQIPSLCHDERVSKNTSCFVCLVQDAETGRWMPSCTSEVRDGMKVNNATPEVEDMRQTALNLLLSEHQGDCEAPCTLACPAHADVEGYVRAGRDGNLLEALRIIKERVPLPMSIGRVCPRFCEDDCRRNVKDQPVAINDFKRLAADIHFEDYQEETKELNGQRVAIIGSGPAGLAAAYFLRREGIGSDIYEKRSQPGGMLRYGIPEYRLPKEILDKELAHFDKMGGINIRCNQELGKDFQLDQLQREYDAVVVAVGCWQASSMRTEGEELAWGGIDFLEKLSSQGYQMEDPGETVVVGGGNTAMDCVRSSIRLTDKPVHCVYRRTEKEMPAEQIEIDEAREEGVNFEFLTQPVNLRREGDKLVVECIRMELGEPDASGRQRPVPVEGSEFEVRADTVIAAIGQKTIAPENLPTNDWGDVAAEKDTTRVKDNIFAVGDCVTGPATVVEAVAAARTAALAVKAHLQGEEYRSPHEINVSRGHWQSLGEDDLVFLQEPAQGDRIPQRHIELERRQETFDEVSFTFTEEEILDEGKRCFECSCTARDDCKLKDYSEAYCADPEFFGGEKVNHGYNADHPDIVMDRGKCIKCGICVKVCADVVNEYLLGFKYRGYETRIDTAFGETLPLECRDCGECLKSCPVGALDWKDKSRSEDQ